MGGKTLLIAMSAKKRSLLATNVINQSWVLTTTCARLVLSLSIMLKWKMILAKTAARIIIKN